MLTSRKLLKQKQKMFSLNINKQNNCYIIEDENNAIYGLYKFKKGFAGQATEMIGEFDLQFKPLWNWLFKVAEQTRKRLRKFISRLKSGK